MPAGRESSAPDFDHFPMLAHRKIIRAGTMLTRIYNYTAPWAGNDYNPIQIRDIDNKPARRGRYSSVDSFPEPFSSLYAATFVGSEAVVLLETIEHKKLVLPSDGSPRVITRYDVRGLAVAYFELKKDVTLVDFTTRPHCRDWYGAKQETLEGSDQFKTREWAKWTRTNVRDAAGIIYRSKQYGSEESGWPVVFFGDPSPSNCDFLEPYDEVRLDEDPGYDLLKDVAFEINIMPESPWR